MPAACLLIAVQLVLASVNAADAGGRHVSPALPQFVQAATAGNNSPANNSPGENESGPAANAPAANAPSSPPASPTVTILGSHEVEDILGREVRSANNEDMGHIVDVLVDRTGLVRAAIIDFGGFLGVGSRKIAVEWSALRFPSSGHNEAGHDDGQIVLELTRDQVKAAPEYQAGNPVVVLGAMGKLEPLPFP
jgi:hypothetical protein